MVRSVDDIKNELEQFEHNTIMLMECEEQLKIIANALYSIGSPKIKSKEEALFKKGTVIYKCNIAELMQEEQDLIVERDYYLLKVRKVASFLQKLSDDEVLLLDDEVLLLHYRYWCKFSIRTIAKIQYTSKSNIFKKLEIIFKKIKNS